MTDMALAETTLSVPDISCAHCEQTVTDALTSLDGIEQVAVDLPSKTVRVAYDPARVDVERMAAVLADEDYPVAAMS
jgi:copper chaperone CopZ